MKRNNMKGTMVNSEVMRAVSEIIRSEVKDPGVKPMTSVTDANVTKDLKYATIYVSVLGSAEEGAETVKALKSASGFIRKELARRLNMRNTPELRFVLDESLAYGMRMSKLIDDVVGKSSPDEDVLKTGEL